MSSIHVNCWVKQELGIIYEHHKPSVTKQFPPQGYCLAALTTFWLIYLSLGLLWWLRGLSVCLQCARPGFDPWVGKIPWRRKWQPTPVFLPGESHGWRNLVGYSPWGRKESDTTGPTSFSLLAFRGKTQTREKNESSYLVNNCVTLLKSHSLLGWNANNSLF